MITSVSLREGRRFARTKEACFSTLLTVLLSTLIPGTGQAGSEHAWARTLPKSLFPVPGTALAIWDFGSDGVTLTASGVYCYVHGSVPTILHGKKEKADLFRVAVSYEVATSGKTGWQKLYPGVEQPTVDSTTVDSEHPQAFVSFNMEPFRHCIGIYRYGRIILENGDTAIIALEDLLPTANARGVSGNFKEDVFSGDYRMCREGIGAPRAGDPAVPADVISFGGGFVAEFIYDAGPNGVILEGIQTSDGDFWPRVSIEVGKSLDDWQKLGTADSNGAIATLQIPGGDAQPFRVDLTRCKRFIGDYKYGKLIFSNGASTVFYLELLDPKS